MTMNKRQKIDALCVLIWLAALGAALTVACLRNALYLCFACASLYFAVLHLTDREGGDSLADLMRRKRRDTRKNLEP